MTRTLAHRVKRASLVIGAVTVVSLGALSFEVEDEPDGLELANDSGAAATTVSIPDSSPVPTTAVLTVTAA